MDKTAMTRFLDYVRYLLIISGTATVMCLFGARINWLLPIILAIPVYVVIFCLVDFLALPLYFLTPEHKIVSVALEAIERDDFNTALRVLEAYEKSDAGELQSNQRAGLSEVDYGQNEFVRVQDETPLEDGMRDILVRCDDLVDSVAEIMHDDSVQPQGRERLLDNSEAKSETDTLVPSNKNILPCNDENTDS